MSGCLTAQKRHKTSEKEHPFSIFNEAMGGILRETFGAALRCSHTSFYDVAMPREQHGITYAVPSPVLPHATYNVN